MATLGEIWDQLRSVGDLLLENPEEGRRVTNAALIHLAELDDPPPDLRAFAAQVTGTACRANGEYEAAEGAYSRAAGIYRDAVLTCDDLFLLQRLVLGRADLWRRWVFLCLERRQWARGLEMLDRAKEFFGAAGERHELGRVHLARGQLLWERAQPGDQDQALEFLAQAVEMIDAEKWETAFRTAEHNLICALTLHPKPGYESLERAFAALQRGRLSRTSRRRSDRRQRFGHSRLSVPDAMRRWLQGKVLLLLRQDDEARPFLQTARNDLLLLGGYPRDVFAVTLDLAECYLWLFKRPWRKVADLIAQTFAICPLRDTTPELEAALELFQAAVAAQNLRSARKYLTAARRHYIDSNPGQ